MTEIKTLIQTDWQIYKQIRLESLKSDPESFHSKYEDYADKQDDYWIGKVKDPNNKIFIAFDNSTHIGIVRIILNDADFPPGSAYLGSLYVRKEYRCKGIASNLLNEAEKYLANIPNIKRIYLNVYTSLENVVKLYISLGFKIDKEQVSDGRSNFVMVKDLDSNKNNQTKHKAN